jgi:hypothetical protein
MPGTRYVGADGAKVSLYLVDESIPNHVTRAHEHFILNIPARMGFFGEAFGAMDKKTAAYTRIPEKGSVIISIPLSSPACSFVAITSTLGYGVSHIETHLSSILLRHMIGNLRPYKCRIAAMPVVKIEADGCLFELGPNGIGLGQSELDAIIMPAPSLNFGGGSSYRDPDAADFFRFGRGGRSRDFIFFVYDAESGKTLVAGRFLGGRDIER